MDLGIHCRRSISERTKLEEEIFYCRLGSLWPGAVILLLFASMLGSSRITAQEITETEKPTAAQSPEEIDRAWKKASAKYDDARQALLKDVDSAIAAGKYAYCFRRVQ